MGYEGMDSSARRTPHIHKCYRLAHVGFRCIEAQAYRLHSVLPNDHVGTLVVVLVLPATRLINLEAQSVVIRKVR